VYFQKCKWEAAKPKHEWNIYRILHRAAGKIENNEERE
jgi:hypothetical protein